MAVWQFDIELMPNPVVASAPRCIDAAITKDGLDTSDWWLPHQPRRDYQSVIATLFAPLDSWCADLYRWGNEDNVLVEALTESGQVVGIGVRIDVRNTDHRSLSMMIDLVEKLDCHICVMETRKIAPPTLDSLLPHIAESRAVQFARDPRGFIEKLARESAR